MQRKEILKIAKEYDALDVGIIDYDEVINFMSLIDTNVEKIQNSDTIFASSKSIDESFWKYKSIITLTFNYFSDGALYKKNTNRPLGILSKSSWGEDYHSVLRKRCENIVSRMLSLKEFEYKIAIDQNPFSERLLAKLSGLGGIGKNQNLITKNGSFVFIATIFVDFKIESDDKVVKIIETQELCGGCNLCEKNCPTGAISKKGYNYMRCISYLTQYKGNIDDDLKLRMGNAFYGCDICQDVCPHNRRIEDTSIEEFLPVKTGTEVDLIEFLEIDKKQFREKYQQMSGAWRGLNVLKRNALIALYNFGFKDEDVFKKYSNSESSIVQKVASEILDRIKNEV